jgi:hypothetical protein
MNRPECKLGYPKTQLRAELTAEEFKAFFKWMRGQTFGSCEGQSYDHEKKEYIPSGCGPHGYVFYATDVNRFLAGGSVVD